jgi:very-short-patch-repair endonuclease
MGEYNYIMTPEQIIESIILDMDLEFKKEVKFHPVRKWRFDYQIVSKIDKEFKLALEIDGGNWSNGRHNRGNGFEEDHIKFNQAACWGWKVLRYTTSQIKNNPKMVDMDIRFLTKDVRRYLTS